MLTIELSWPERALWPNARPDRRAKASVARIGRNEAYVVTLKALETQTLETDGVSVKVNLIGCRPSQRGYDRDNFQAACKSRLDGIAQALKLDDVYFDPHVVWGENRPPRGALVVVVGA